MRVVNKLAEYMPCWVKITHSCNGTILDDVVNISLGYVEAEDFSEWDSFDPDVLYYKVVYRNHNGEHTEFYKVTDSRIRPFGNSDEFDFSEFDSLAKKYYDKYADDCIRDEEVKKAEELKHLKETTKPRYFKRVKGGVLDAVDIAYSEEYIAKLRKMGYKEISRDYYKDIMSRGHLAISYNYE